MCLGVPGQIVELEGTTAVVDFGGVRRNVALDLVDDEVVLGDHVLVHVGFAIRRIAPEDLSETLAFFEAMAGDPSGPGASATGPSAASAGDAISPAAAGAGDPSVAPKRSPEGTA